MDAKHWTGDDDREDVCTEDASTCECPECRTWRDNREPSDAELEGRTLDNANGYARYQERQAAAMRLKR